MANAQTAGVPGETVVTVQSPHVAGSNPLGVVAPFVIGASRAGSGVIDLIGSALPTDATAVGLSNEPYLMALSMAHTGAGWARLKTPNTFKSVSATVITSETTVWTPAAGKKFRLMGYCLAQGVVTGAITLKDNTAGSTILVIPQHTIAITGPFVTLGNGILSVAANNVLTATGASTETITGFFFGTEE